MFLFSISTSVFDASEKCHVMSNCVSFSLPFVGNIRVFFLLRFRVRLNWKRLYLPALSKGRVCTHVAKPSSVNTMVINTMVTLAALLTRQNWSMI